MQRIQTGVTLLRGSFAVVGSVPALLVPGLVHAVTTLGVAGAVAVSVGGDVAAGCPGAPGRCSPRPRCSRCR